MAILRVAAILFVVVGIVAGGAYFVITKSSSLPILGNSSLMKSAQPIAEAAASKIIELLPKSLPSTKILGAVDDKSASDLKPLPLEQARYTYCKQVVDDFSHRYGASSSGEKK